MSHRIRGYHVIAASVVVLGSCLLALGSPSANDVEKLLRWKYQKGDTRIVTIAQNTNIAITKDQRTTNVKMQQTLVLRQLVEDVDEQGNATIQHQFQRIHMNVQAAPERSFEYDSANPKQARGRIAEVAPIFKTLVNSEFTTKVSPKGKILEVELPADFVATVESAKVEPSLFAFSSKEGFRNLMEHSAAVFPDQPVAQNDQWSDRVELEDSAVGRQIVTTTYTYEGEEDVGGQPLDKIDMTVLIEFPAGEANGSQVVPKDQKTLGTLWFNADSGQLVRANVDQNLTMEVRNGSEVVLSQISGEVDVKVTADAPSE